MRLLAATIVALALAACASGPGEAEVIGSVTDRAIIPTAETAAADSAALADAVEAFCADPQAASLEAAQTAWREAKNSWEVAEIATFHGPGHMLRTVAKVDYEPISPESIDELLASDTAVDVDYIDNRVSSTRRGLGAVEYVLFDDLDPSYSPRACELMQPTTVVIATETAAHADAWTTSHGRGDAYSITFTEEMTTDAAMGDIVSSIVETLKRQSRFELGRALGITAQEPDPTAIPEGEAGAGAARYVAQIQSIDRTLTAGGESSLSAMIAARSEDTASQIESLLAEAEETFAGIDRSLVAVATDEPESLTEVQAVLDELVTLFEADVVSLLDITLGFSDTDGDSG